MGGRSCASSVDGMHESERRVMDLFDAGKSVTNIEAVTGYSRATITTIVSRLGVTALEPWKDDARQGSSALIAALRRHHPDRCGAAS